MYIAKGSLVLGEWQGAPIRLHWSVLLGGLVFGGVRWAPGFLLGFALLVLIHELGHAFLVRRFGKTIHDVVVHGFGGYCSWSGSATPRQEAIIAWGGVWAQGLLLPFAFLWGYLKVSEFSNFEWEFYHVFTRTNIWLILLNLIPVAPLDGARAWSLVPILWRDFKHRGGLPSGKRASGKSSQDSGGPGDAWMNELLAPLRKADKDRDKRD